MKAIKKTLIGLFLAALMLTAFSGCRTAHGFGEDMEDAGHSIQKETR